MPQQWEIFPRQRWPRGFGHREWKVPRVFIDGDQLELSWELVTAVPHQITALENLRRMLELSKLPQATFAQWVLGCAEFTLTRYLRGGRIPEGRSNFLRRLQSVSLHGEYITIVLHAGQVRRLPRWRLERGPT